jgi:hypothetical protein
MQPCSGKGSFGRQTGRIPGQERSGRQEEQVLIAADPDDATRQQVASFRNEFAKIVSSVEQVIRASPTVDEYEVRSRGGDDSAVTELTSRSARHGLPFDRRQ